METVQKIYKDSLFKNSIYLMVTNLVSLILGFFFWIIASRYYTPNDIGIVSTILSSMSLISMISSVGFPTALLFYLPRDQNNVDKVINSCITVSVVISTVFSAVFVLGLSIWEPLLKSTFNSLGLIVIFVIITIMTTVSALMSGVFTAERRSSFAMIKDNIFGLAKIFPLALFAGIGTIGIFISWGVGLIVAVIIGFILLCRILKYSPMLMFDPVIKSMAGYSAMNYIAGILYNLPKLILPIMIASTISTESAGYFFIAMTVAGLLYGISQSISSSLLVESFKGDIWKNISKAIRFNLFIIIPGLLSFMVFGRFVMSLFNHSYEENATVTLIILAMASIPLSAINIFNTVRNIQKRTGSTVKINAIVAVMTLIMSVPLMRIMGIEGAALAYLIGNVTGAIIIIIRIKSPIEFTLRLLKRGKDVISI